MKSIVDLDNLYFLKAVDRFATAAVQNKFHQDDDGYFLEYVLNGMCISGGFEYKKDQGKVVINW